MQKDETYYRQLVIDFIDKKLSVSQVEELFDFINEEPALHEQVFESEEVKAKLMLQAENEAIEVSEPIRERIWKRIATVVEGGRDTIIAPVHRVHFLRRSWTSWAAAAIILIAASIGIYRYNQSSNTTVTATESGAQQPANDIAPGQDGAILVLSDGRQVLLDSLGNGVVAQEGETTVRIQNGQLVYDAAARSTEVLYNTMTTPKGRQYRLVLPDGSQVWLNAASSITYPTTFSASGGKERRVAITGEAYFEVNPQRSTVNGERIPFIVTKGDLEVQVLGTHFNVNAYDDEQDIKVTLLEGKVKVTHSANRQPSTLILLPGQQAIATTDPGLRTTRPDLDAVMAWKNGKFQFNRTPLTEVLRQLSRWYDVEIEYQGEVPKVFFAGKIGRDLNLSQVLILLNKMEVNFKIEGKKLIVMP